VTAQRKKLRKGSVPLSSRPDLAAQFFPEDNDGLLADEVAASTNAKLWWRCPRGPDHRWPARGASRAGGAGCPCCSGRQACEANDLRTHPDLAAQFFPEDNNGLTADRVVAGTASNLWWRCQVALDHRWRATGNNRVSAGTGCPSCAGLKVSVTNDLNSHPALAAQYFAEDNKGLRADQVIAWTNRVLWWRCPKGPDHRFDAAGSTRLSGSGCPFCAGRRPSVTNNLLNFPHLVREYFPQDNAGVPATKRVAGGKTKLWWRCVERPTHRWPATAAERARGGGCPRCASSQGERAVDALLRASGLEYMREFRPPGLRDLGALRVDFALPSLRLLVEFDGPQHYRLVNFGGTHAEAERAFALIQKHDAMKDDWARAHGWALLRLTEVSTAAAELAAELTRAAERA
jgi:very-short-patch-repair endonuclease